MNTKDSESYVYRIENTEDKEEFNTYVEIKFFTNKVPSIKYWNNSKRQFESTEESSKYPDEKPEDFALKKLNQYLFQDNNWKEIKNYEFESPKKIPPNDKDNIIIKKCKNFRN